MNVTHVILGSITSIDPGNGSVRRLLCQSVVAAQ
jgi:hypothetical protein